MSNLSLLNYLNLDLNEIEISNTGFGIVLENLELLNDCTIIVDARNNIVGGIGLSEYD